MNAMKPKNLGMAYNIKNRGARRMSKGGSVGCRECMAMGGKCMAHGGDVSNEEMDPQYEGSMAADMLRDESIERDPGMNQSKIARRYADGGEVPSKFWSGKANSAEEAEKMANDSWNRMDEVRETMRPKTDPSVAREPDLVGYSKGGSVLDEILNDRKSKRMARGGAVMNEQPVKDDFEMRIDMEPVHTREDEEHDVESGSLDDESLVGQIVRERRKRRGDME